MSGCLSAQHAHRRIERTDEVLLTLARQVELLAERLGVDLDHEAVLTSPGVTCDMPATWDQMIALGRNPLTGAPLGEAAA